MTKFEENNYTISVDQKSNRIDLVFIESIKKMPKYLEHIKEAINLVSPGFILFVHITEKSGSPGFASSRILKEGQKLLKEAKVKKTAVILDPKMVLQKLTLDTVTKLSGYNLRTFTDKNAAEEWLKKES